MKDFTVRTYENIIKSLISQGFSFQTLTEFVEKHGEKVILLRHDVDKLPGNSLVFARIQAEKGIKGTYYFRAVPDSWDEAIIKEIAGMGHEIGYHYEDLGATVQRRNGAMAEEELVKIAIESFTKNLEKLRKIVPVKTICMHGSPMNRWDSRLLWKYYDYRDFGIIGEPYFDINFDEVLYLTDTGRRWDGDSVNIRDKAVGKAEGRRQKAEGKTEEANLDTLQPSAFSPQPSSPYPQFHSTFEIIQAANEGRLPDKIMMTFHPQRWTDKPVPWVKELVWQNVKNVGKYFLNKLKKDEEKKDEETKRRRDEERKR